MDKFMTNPTKTKSCLISDVHEWINEIPTVPIYYLAKPQPRERAWQNQLGKKTLWMVNHLTQPSLNLVYPKVQYLAPSCF